VAYFSVFRSWLKGKLQAKDQPSNVDALLGSTGVVTKRIAPRDAGVVKVGAEEWRAELAQPDGAVREVGAVVTVSEVAGVTLKAG
jgi:membrane protein implicated in regulation of membrane protease activity